jgi:hypothetical protein
MPRVRPGPPCQVCGIPSQARNLCAKHLKRWQRHGHVEQTRPADWGAREKHPLSGQWRWTNRVRERRVERWNDFWTFVADVGERPSERHVLRRYDAKRPFGPDNFYWLGTVADLDRNARMREYRKRNPLVFKRLELKKQFGITLEEYDALLEKQNGKCAICKQEERALRSNGAAFGLAVDHCHTSRRVRGLLCGKCNRALGGFADSPQILRNAIEYLTTAAPSPP